MLATRSGTTCNVPIACRLAARQPTPMHTSEGIVAHGPHDLRARFDKVHHTAQMQQPKFSRLRNSQTAMGWDCCAHMHACALNALCNNCACVQRPTEPPPNQDGRLCHPQSKKCVLRPHPALLQPSWCTNSNELLAADTHRMRSQPSMCMRGRRTPLTGWLCIKHQNKKPIA